LKQGMTRREPHRHHREGRTVRRGGARKQIRTVREETALEKKSRRGAKSARALTTAVERTGGDDNRKI